MLTARQATAYAALDALLDEAADWVAAHGPILPPELHHRLDRAADAALAADFDAPLTTPDVDDDVLADRSTR